MHKFDGAENLTVFVRYDYNEQARSFANSRKKFRIQFARSCGGPDRSNKSGAKRFKITTFYKDQPRPLFVSLFRSIVINKRHELIFQSNSSIVGYPVGLVS